MKYLVLFNTIMLCCLRCSRLLCATYLNEEYFDLVDVDSFGGETMHLPAAIDSVKYGGMLYLTSTDGFSGAGEGGA